MLEGMPARKGTDHVEYESEESLASLLVFQNLVTLWKNILFTEAN